MDFSPPSKMDYAECIYLQNNIDIENNNVLCPWSKMPQIEHSTLFFWYLNLHAAIA